MRERDRKDDRKQEIETEREPWDRLCHHCQREREREREWAVQVEKCLNVALEHSKYSLILILAQHYLIKFLTALSLLASSPSSVLFFRGWMFVRSFKSVDLCCCCSSWNTATHLTCRFFCLELGQTTGLNISHTLTPCVCKARSSYVRCSTPDLSTRRESSIPPSIVST